MQAKQLLITGAGLSTCVLVAGDVSNDAEDNDGTAPASAATAALLAKLQVRVSTVAHMRMYMVVQVWRICNFLNKYCCCCCFYYFC